MSLETRLAALITAIGADVKALQAASGGGGGSSSIFDTSDKGFTEHEDFVTTHDLAVSLSGTGATTAYQNPPIDLTSAGVLVLSLGTGSSNLCTIRGASPKNDAFGNGIRRYSTRIRLPNLSTATDRFLIGLGWMDDDWAAPFNGVFFDYSDNINGGKWRCKCRRGGSTEDVADSGVTVAANTWYKLEIEVNAAGTQAKFWINGTLVATMNSSNIPTNVLGTALGTTHGVYFTKQAGTNNRQCQVDWLATSTEFTTTR